MSMEEIIVPPTHGMRIVYETGPFDTSLETLARERESLWSAEQLAGLRVKLGAAHPVSTNGSWVSNGIVYLNDSSADILIVNGTYNPFLKDPKTATQAHREGKEVYLDVGQMLHFASDDVTKARQTGVFLLRRNQAKTSIRPEAFGDEAQTQFLLGSAAGEYGRFLTDQKINSVPFYLADADYARKQEQSFGRALWVSNLDDRSGLSGNLNDLRIDLGRVGGVSSYVREAGAPENSLLERSVLTAMRGGASSVTLGEHVYTLQPK